MIALLKNLKNNFHLTSDIGSKKKLSTQQKTATVSIVELTHDQYLAVAGGPQISNHPPN
jgi:hypothetical protein